MHTRTCMQAHTHACMRTCTHTHTHTHTHTVHTHRVHTHTHTNTVHTHTHTHRILKFAHSDSQHSKHQHQAYPFSHFCYWLLHHSLENWQILISSLRWWWKERKALKDMRKGGLLITADHVIIWLQLIAYHQTDVMQHGESAVQSKSSGSWKPELSMTECGHIMDGWPLHARLCTDPEISPVHSVHSTKVLWMWL